MNDALVPLVRTLDLNTRLFLNALDGVDDKIATSRPNESTNHIAFVACHLVDARHYLGNAVGRESISPFKELEGARGIDDIEKFPTVDEIRSAWTNIAKTLSHHLTTLSDSDLEKELERPFPIEGGKTILAAITFLLQHDSFHIGQLAFVRRFFGLEALKYS
ncbi:MAG: DinB family protein [Vicinamibacteria bacterium]